MEDWIDIIRQRLQDAQTPLPPGDWEEFAAKSLPAKRTRVLPWLLSAGAVAAGLAAVFFLRQPAAPDGGVQVIPQPSAPVAVVTDTADADEPETPAPIVAQAVMPRVRPAAVRPQKVVDVQETASVEEVVVTPPEEESATPEPQESVTPGPVIPSSSPFVPEPEVPEPVRIKVEHAVGAVASGGLLTALVVPALGKRQAGNTWGDIASVAPGGISDDTNSYYGAANSVFNGGYNYMSNNYLSYSSGWMNDAPHDLLVGNPTHRFPLKVGLSAWIPVKGRLNLSTGLDYSWYQSTFTYSLSGEQKQHVHYLGIPARLDWVFASGKRLDAYVGGGLEGEFCLEASLGGKEISKDRIKLSLVGVGGIQMNLTRRLGLYVEPQLIWLMPTDAEDNMLATYRSTHPLMFSVATGVRITIGN